MISAELVNNSDSEAAINIAGIKPYSLDRENGEITRLSICESIFYDYAESTGADYGNMTLKAGEHRNIVLCMVEPDKIVKNIIEMRMAEMLRQTLRILIMTIFI